jgi:hypothetical protein
MKRLGKAIHPSQAVEPCVASKGLKLAMQPPCVANGNGGTGGLAMGEAEGEGLGLGVGPDT